MFIFDDPKDYDPIEQIEQRANPPATSVGKPLLITAALGVGGFALTSSAIVGGSLAALPAYMLIKRLNKVWSNNVFLRRFPGCYAHLIRTQADMIQWIEAHGRDEVTEQLRIALVNRQRLTPCAKATAKLLIPPASLPPKNVVAYLTAETPAGIGSGSAHKDQVEPHPQLANIIIGDIALSLAHKLKPTIISARPRVGKGIITSHAIGHVKQRHGATVWVLQPKPAPTELAYWKHADRFLALNLEDYPVDDPDIALKLTAFFMEWRSQPHRPTLLVVDELIKIQAMQPKWYKSQFIPQVLVEGSSGETDGRYLWCITQSPLVSDLGMSGGNRSAFDFMAIERWETTDHAESVRKSVSSLNSIPAESDYQKSPVGCLMYHSAYGRWAAVPEYPIPKIERSDQLCPELEALVRPAPAYAVVTTAPTIDSVDVEPEIPAWMQAVAASAVTTAFYQPSGDPIEFALLNYFRNRPGQSKAVRDILSAKIKALEGIKSGEIRDYLDCLTTEGKLNQDGQLYRFAG